MLPFVKRRLIPTPQCKCILEYLGYTFPGCLWHNKSLSKSTGFRETG